MRQSGHDTTPYHLARPYPSAQNFAIVPRFELVCAAMNARVGVTTAGRCRVLGRRALRYLALSALHVGLGFGAGCGGPVESKTPDEPAPSRTNDEVRASGARQPSAHFESDPELMRKLGEAESRTQAVTQLVERFAEVGKNGTKTPEAMAFADAYASHATAAYVDGYSALPTPLRHKLLQTLLAFNHEATTKAFVSAIRSYATTGEGADDAIWACEGATRRKDSAFEQPLLDAYKAIDTSDKDGLRYSRHLAAAMAFQRTDAWNGPFEQELSTPLVPPPRYDDKPAVRLYQSGLFRQTIALRLLGESNSDSAAEVIISVLLDGNKAELHPAAELALANVGGKAVPQLLTLLNEQGPFVEPAKQARPDIKASSVYFATKWLDLIRDPETEADLLKSWAETRDPVARTMLVRSLSRLPHSKNGVDALKTTYAQTDIKVTLPEGESALEVLTEAAVQFYEPGLALWLRERTEHVPTVWTRRGDVLTTLVIDMSRLLREQDVPKAEVTAQRYGGKTGTPAFNTAKSLVLSCHENSQCYLEALTTNASSFSALKAATMIGCFGSAEARDALIDVAVATDAPEVLNQVLASIEELTTGDTASAYAKLYDKSRQQLESTTPTWSRAKRTAIGLTLARLKP